MKKSYLDYLQELTEMELDYRTEKRIKRLFNQAKLPHAKTLNSFEIDRIPGLSQSQIQEIAIRLRNFN